MLLDSFPLYALRNYESITEEDGVTFIRTARKLWILDDRNLEGDYSTRRLKLLDKGVEVYPLYNRIDSYSSLVKSKYKNVIDSEGKIYTFNKTSTFPLICDRIIKRKELGLTGTVLWFQRSGGPFKVYDNCYPYDYALILCVTDKHRELYELLVDPVKDSWRKL